jgi:hypothetical protein
MEKTLSKGRKRREAERKANLRYKVVYTDLFDWEAVPFAVSDPLPYEEAVALCEKEQEGHDPEFDRFQVVQITEPRGPATENGAEEAPRKRRKPRHKHKGPANE